MIRSGTPIGRKRPGVDWDELILSTLAFLWQCRLELLILAAMTAVHRLVAGVGGEAVATAAVVGLGVAVASVGPCRRRLWGALRRAWLRRGWERAAVDAGLSEGPLRVPRMVCARRIPAGDVLRVR